MVETETFITVTLHNANAACHCIMGNVQLQVTSLRAEGIFFCFLEKANVELRPLGETVTLDWSPMRQKQNNILEIIRSVCLYNHTASDELSNFTFLIFRLIFLLKLLILVNNTALLLCGCSGYYLVSMRKYH